MREEVSNIRVTLACRPRISVSNRTHIGVVALISIAPSGAIGEANGARTSGVPSGCSADADVARGPPRDVVARPPGGESAKVDRRALCMGVMDAKRRDQV